MIASLPALPISIEQLSHVAAQADLIEVLISMFIKEVSTHPNQNPPTCQRCGHQFSLEAMDGQTCRRVVRFNLLCGGKISKPWTEQTAKEKIDSLIEAGCLYTARINSAKAPVGFVVCEMVSQAFLEAVVGMGNEVLARAFSSVGSHSTYMLISHLWVEEDELGQRAVLVAKDLMLEAIGSQMARTLARQTVPVLILASQRSDVRARAIQSIGFPVIMRDNSPGNLRALYGHNVRST